MGALLAKFRKQMTTTEVLEGLQERIEVLERFTFSTQEQKKRVVGNFLAVAIGIYVLAFVIFYFVYFPPTWKERIIYSTPLILFPIVIIFLRHLFTWYFQRKLNKNSKKLTALRAEKKKILEQVMDKETYKVAVKLLARFGDTPNAASYGTTTTNTKILSPMSTAQLGSRTLPPPLPNKTHLSTSTPIRPPPNTPQRLGTALTPTTGPNNTPISHSMRSLDTRLSPSGMMMPRGTNQQLRRRTPFPIVNPHEKSTFERIVDVLIGDGPQDRFAMICQQCYGHNGMALKEEFEYATFRCVYCNSLNPARKSRPVAPRLSVLPPPAKLSTPSISGSSDSLTDDNYESDHNKINEERRQQSFAVPAAAAAAADDNEDDDVAAAAVILNQYMSSDNSSNVAVNDDNIANNDADDNVIENYGVSDMEVNDISLISTLDEEIEMICENITTNMHVQQQQQQQNEQQQPLPLPSGKFPPVKKSENLVETEI